MLERTTVSLLTLTLFTGCISYELTDRYEYSRREPAEQDYVEVHAFSTDPPTARNSLRITDLAPQAQAALVASLGSKTSTARSLREALAQPLTASRSSSVVDLTRVRRRVVIATRLTEHVTEPADRLQRLEVKLVLAQGSPRFYAWDRFVTTYGEVDLGKVKFDQGHTFGAKLSAGPDASETIPVSGELSYEHTRNLSEEVSLRRRYVALAGALSPHEAILWQRGASGIDLAGTVTVDLDVQFPLSQTVNVVRLTDPFNGRTPRSGDEITVSTAQLLLPEAQDLRATVSARYRLRHVRCNGDTVPEGDDWITLLDGDALLPDPNLTLVHRDNLVRHGYKLRLRAASPGETTATTGYLALQGVGELIFEDQHTALALLRWLNNPNNPQTLGGYQLVNHHEQPLGDERSTLMLATIPLN